MRRVTEALQYPENADPSLEPSQVAQESLEYLTDVFRLCDV